MATGVARGGTLFLVGHRPIDPATGAATAAARHPSATPLLTTECCGRSVVPTGQTLPDEA
jgi:hypothetical protein